MPVVPGENEDQGDFIERCIASEVMQEEYPEMGERVAVCYQLAEDFKSIRTSGSPFFASSKAFKRCARAKALNLPLVAKEIIDPNPINVANRSIRFIISTPEKDRDGDVIKQAGWQLKNYKSNPVVLLNHKTHELPIGKCVGIGTEAGMLRATVQFAPADYPTVGPLAETVWRMCKDGFLAATSVGFKPLDWDWLDDESDGILYKAQELLEFSIVTVPSNPSALVEPVQPEPPKQLQILNMKLVQAMRLRILELDI